MATHIDGKLAPANQVEAAGVNNYSDLAYLSGFGDRGQYSITNHAQDLGFGVEWDARLFKYLWYWLERNGLKSFEVDITELGRIGSGVTDGSSISSSQKDWSMLIGVCKTNSIPLLTSPFEQSSSSTCINYFLYI